MNLSYNKNDMIKSTANRLNLIMLVYESSPCRAGLRTSQCLAVQLVLIQEQLWGQLGVRP